MTDNTPTLHHLDCSQSQRILWLLEELSIPYNLEIHTRNPASHPQAPLGAPTSVTSLGPYGKAPILVTGARDGHRYIPESLAIATYLIRTFDDSDKFGLRNGDWIRDEMLVSFILTELGLASMVMLYMDLQAISNGVGAKGQIFDGPALRKSLGYLEKELKNGPEGGFLMGSHPGRADIMVEFMVTLVRQRGWLDLATEFPVVNEWLDRCYERPAWKRSMEKGNGYDLTMFPKKEHLQVNL
ncbi:hypothetical protein EAF04_004679 [Stromatinia cepivora]|nr:hypothetical protein EAF04_004679 [Stromatinia cepivora]